MTDTTPVPIQWTAELCMSRLHMYFAVILQDAVRGKYPSPVSKTLYEGVKTMIDDLTNPQQTASPETDLRAVSVELTEKLNDVMVNDLVDALERRPSRPDALREKVLTAIHTACDEFDATHSSWSWFELLDALETAVAAVWEGVE